jgi:NAD(P)-dependent dehydrogenase (short-subunit alcohol dehydrogenase family)
MSTQTTISRPAKFVEDLGTDLAKQAVALTGVPVVSGGIGSLSRQTGETAAGFKARQDAARAFDVRKQNLAGLAPQVAAQDKLQQQAQTLAQKGVGSFQPFLKEAQLASGATFDPRITQQFMSPYQSQVMEASLAEFDRNKAIQEQGLRDQAVASGAFGGGREGVAMAEYDKVSDMNRAQLQAGLLQQGFNQAQQLAAQRFGQQQGLAQLVPGLQRGDISTLGSLGALNQAQAQAGLDATRAANQMAAYQPQEQLQNYGNLVTGIMGGMAGSGTQQTQVPNPGFLQTALGAAATGAGIYGALK